MRVGAGEGEPVGPRGLARRLGGAMEPLFSICVMLTDWREYEECTTSFRGKGFDESCCEFIVLDNSAGNRADAYVALNEFLQAARGRYVILCHQDVLLLDDGRDELETWLAELERIDPAWGVCGNAGHSADGWPTICISHPYSARDIQGAPFPTRVVSLDENFMVVRRAANLALSRDLSGFHHYAADLCTIADILGWNAYVIGFFLKHKSGGTFDARYERSRALIAAKYRRALRPRWVHLITRRPFFISGLPLHARAARWQRMVGKLIGALPRDRDLSDPAKRARHERRGRQKR